MINRRTLLALSTAGVAVGLGGRHVGAQDDESNLPVKNASFVRDLSESGSATPVATPGETTELDLENLRGYIKGDPDAPNTLQIFADYRCPHCRVFHRDIEPNLLKDFVETGNMNIEVMDFTVIGVPSYEELVDDSIESVQAAEAAACAAEQGAWLEFREWLYSGEERTSEGDFSDDNLISAAEELGLDVDLFSESLLNGVYEAGIIAMVDAGLDAGVQGTPTLIFNGGDPFFMPADGYDALKELLESGME